MKQIDILMELFDSLKKEDKITYKTAVRYENI